MTQYLISFDEGAMVDLDHPDLPAIAKAAEDATQEAMDAGRMGVRWRAAAPGGKHGHTGGM